MTEHDGGRGVWRMATVAVLTVAALAAMATPARAFVGLGVRVGRTVDFDRPEFAELGLASPSNMPLYGAHMTFGAIPLLSVELAVERAAGTERGAIEFGGETYEGIGLRVRDFAVYATVKYEFSRTLLRPYIGAGLSIHLVTYELKGLPSSIPQGPLGLPGDDQSIGGQILVGLALRPMMSPIGLFGELRVAKFESGGINAQATSIYAGVTIGG